MCSSPIATPFRRIVLLGCCAANSLLAQKLPPEAERLAAQAWQDMAHNRFASAHAEFVEVLRMAPQEPETLYGLAWSSYWVGKWADAENAFATLETTSPSNGDGFAGRVFALVKLGRFNEAKREAVLAFARSPGRSVPSSPEYPHHPNNYFETAVAEYDHLFERRPSRIDQMIGRGESEADSAPVRLCQVVGRYRFYDKNYVLNSAPAVLRHDLQALTNLLPGDPDIVMIRGLLYTLEGAGEMPFDRHPIEPLEFVESRSGSTSTTEQAIMDLSFVIRSRPDLPEAYKYRAVCFARIGYWGHAVLDLRRALTLRPSDLDAAKALAQWESQHNPEIIAFERNAALSKAAEENDHRAAAQATEHAPLFDGQASLGEGEPADGIYIRNTASSPIKLAVCEEPSGTTGTWVSLRPGQSYRVDRVNLDASAWHLYHFAFARSGEKSGPIRISPFLTALPSTREVPGPGGMAMPCSFAVKDTLRATIDIALSN
ncbi:MAG TPA: hypothetical protein VG936_14745 [Lacunisphaera sp.]|nr:hypothetical protein [Lacunisphaera sp.]